MGFVCVAIIAAGIATPRRAIESQLYRHAEQVISDLSSRALSVRDPSSWASEMSRAAVDVRYMIAYAVFDEKGHRLAGDPKISPRAVSPSGKSSLPRIRLEKTNDLERTDVATVTTPVTIGNRPVGSVVVTFDQSLRAQLLRDGMSWTAGMMLLLLGLGVGASALFAWIRARESRHAMERAEFFTAHDAVTGLPNRTSFVSRLDETLARRSPIRAKTTLLRLNVDGFRQINDSNSPGVGDNVLKIMAERMRGQVRDGDMLARLDGDEFAIAIFEMLDVEFIAGFVDRLLDALREPYRIDGTSISCTMTAGISVAPMDGEDAETLLKNADLALMRAKQDGGDRACFFETGMDKALQRRRALEQELKLALAREEFELAYQPQIELSTGQMIGYEALIRWRHPVHGKIAPGHFISVAEETGLIVDIGEWVLRRACLDAASWPDSISVAVNLSPAQFKHGSVSSMVEQVLRQTGLKPRRLEIEITESLLIADTDAAFAELARLRALGVAIAMDDFGTGYSSLSYLARFPFNKIKIDRGFTSGLMRDATVSAIVSTIVALGRALGIVVTAEGVEHEDQAALLKQLGCAQAQGYLFGRPTSLADMTPPAEAILAPAPRAA